MNAILGIFSSVHRKTVREWVTGAVRKENEEERKHRKGEEESKSEKLIECDDSENLTWLLCSFFCAISSCK